MNEAHPIAPVSEDLLAQDAVRESVRDRYRGVLGQATEVAVELYSRDELALIPEGATIASLGVGNPVRRAGLIPGESVIDLGCGAGIDTLLAARLVKSARSHSPNYSPYRSC